MAIRSRRKDHVALEAAGELSQVAAARLIGVTTATLSNWRKAGFAAQGVAISWRQVHGRLVAYKRDSVLAFIAARQHMALAA